MQLLGRKCTKYFVDNHYRPSGARNNQRWSTAWQVEDLVSGAILAVRWNRWMAEIFQWKTSRRSKHRQTLAVGSRVDRFDSYWEKRYTGDKERGTCERTVSGIPCTTFWRWVVNIHRLAIQFVAWHVAEVVRVGLFSPLSEIKTSVLAFHF